MSKPGREQGNLVAVGPVGVDVHPAVLRVEQHLPFAVERIPLDRLFANGKDPGVHIIKEHIEFLGRVVPPSEGLFGVAEVFLEVAEEVVPLRRIVSLKGFPHLAGTHPVPVCAGGAPWAGGFCIAQQSHGVILVVVDVEPERDRRFRPHIREGRRRNGQQEQGGE